MMRLRLHTDIAPLATLPDIEAQVGCYLLARHGPEGVPWSVRQAGAVTGLWRSEVERGVAELIRRGLVVVDEQRAA